MTAGMCRGGMEHNLSRTNRLGSQRDGRKDGEARGGMRDTQKVRWATAVLACVCVCVSVPICSRSRGADSPSVSVVAAPQGDQCVLRWPEL